MIYTWVW